MRLSYRDKEIDCGPPAKSGGGGGKRGSGSSDWVKFSPQDVLNTMTWCREKGGDEWKVLFNGCCLSRALLSTKGESVPAKDDKRPTADVDDSDIPF